jgi:SprT protein
MPTTDPDSPRQEEQLLLQLDESGSPAGIDSARGPLALPPMLPEGTITEPDVNILPSASQLIHQCQQWLTDLGLNGAAKLVNVKWNARLRSTAGYAHYPSWVIELNPRLSDFEGQVERTLKHELAHLIAYHRAGRRRIEPHGDEWRMACAQLGIPGESARHQLPLPRSQMTRKLTYQCPNCGFLLHRVRPMRRATACLHCCNQFSGGRYDARFKFSLISSPTTKDTAEA